MVSIRTTWNFAKENCICELVVTGRIKRKYFPKSHSPIIVYNSQVVVLLRGRSDFLCVIYVNFTTFTPFHELCLRYLTYTTYIALLLNVKAVTGYSIRRATVYIRRTHECF